jgi:hypothetical protein
MKGEWYRRWSDGDVAYVWQHDPEHPRVGVDYPPWIWLWEYVDKTQGPIERGTAPTREGAIADAQRYRSSILSR